MSRGTVAREQIIRNLSEIQFTDINRSGFYNTYYFRDYNDLFNTIDEVFSDRGTEFDTFKCADHVGFVRELK